MKTRKYIVLTVVLLMAVMFGAQGCHIFTFSGCTRGGYPAGARIRVTELIYHTGCQTLRCPRASSYDVTANSQGVISYNKDEDGLCFSSKLSFTFIGLSLNTFNNLSGSVNLQAPPSSVTIGGSGIDTTYGMPIMHLYDYNGTFIGKQTATSCDGWNWATFNLETLTNPYSGTYHAKVARMRWDGNYEEIGDAPIDCYGYPRVDNDGDGSYCDQDCNDNNPNIYPYAAADCSGYLWDANCNGRSDTMESECSYGGGGGGGCLNQEQSLRPMPCYAY
jgi:hypothetical protein